MPKLSPLMDFSAIFYELETDTWWLTILDHTCCDQLCDV